ncbi:ATP-binding protein [Streptomyces sp. MP131-18]|uniref:sensor histidine kinase n=1 Tax=Streptomyces sp. MP131-18 TaxID=1857892 RepID=UPI0009D5496E|nr:ATP-binding protein [Streptomyces sp. MP131-18]ONK09769.1 Sensor kinase CusS [Streptomyces sp. MP131-18]
MRPRLTARLTARGRLALLHTAMVSVAGAVLTVLIYLLMRRSLGTRTLVERRTAPGAAQEPPEPPGLPGLAERARGEALATLVTQAGIALMVVSLLAAALGWLVAGRVLRPIRAMTVTARRVSAENVSERVPVNAPADELSGLATTVNGMLDRIQRGIHERDVALESQRMFTANAAHELRTPLATMRTAIDVTLDGEPGREELTTMAHDVRAAVEQSRRTLDGLLALAGSQAAPRERLPADLADAADAALGDAAAEARARGVTPRARLRPARVRGEPVLLERMARNLVDNALRYNHPGGRITVQAGTAAGEAFLRVANTGPRVAAEAADGLFAPFVRGDDDRARAERGAGLGLAIVRAVATAHGGAVTAKARPAGGLDITVRLPSGDGGAG